MREISPQTWDAIPIPSFSAESHASGDYHFDDDRASKNFPQLDSNQLGFPYRKLFKQEKEKQPISGVQNKVKLRSLKDAQGIGGCKKMVVGSDDESEEKRKKGKVRNKSKTS